MRKNRIGALFMVSVLALAGIGISYAGFTDTITVSGTVNTATVDLDIIAYSCTKVWKIWDWPPYLPPPDTYEPPQIPGLTYNPGDEYAYYHGNCSYKDDTGQIWYVVEYIETQLWLDVPFSWENEAWARAQGDDFQRSQGRSRRRVHSHLLHAQYRPAHR